MYRESTPSFAWSAVARYGASVQSYAEAPLTGWAEFFWNIRGESWFYDKNGEDRQLLDGIWGVRFRLGPLELGTGYERRYSWGESPMLWDGQFRAEKIHQKIRFPLGREIYAEARGSYDLDADEMAETRCALQWINDCMKWELSYLNDHEGDNDKYNLRVTLLAFPNTPASFGEDGDEDVFQRPKDIP
jgi:hypothetical protein